MRFHHLEAEPELYETFIEMLGDGATREQIGKTFGVNKSTVTDWTKRPDVRDRLAKYIRDRASSVLRHTDSKIVKRLEALGDKVSIDQLLKIRHEFAGENVNLNVTGDGAAALTELLNEADANPEVAAVLSKVLRTDERA